jgi:hypothetical protein
MAVARNRNLILAILVLNGTGIAFALALLVLVRTDLRWLSYGLLTAGPSLLVVLIVFQAMQKLRVPAESVSAASYHLARPWPALIVDQLLVILSVVLQWPTVALTVATRSAIGRLSKYPERMEARVAYLMVPAFGFVTASILLYAYISLAGPAKGLLERIVLLLALASSVSLLLRNAGRNGFLAQCRLSVMPPLANYLAGALAVLLFCSVLVMGVDTYLLEGSAPLQVQLSPARIFAFLTFQSPFDSISSELQERFAEGRANEVADLMAPDLLRQVSLGGVSLLFYGVVGQLALPSRHLGRSPAEDYLVGSTLLMFGDFERTRKIIKRMSRICRYRSQLAIELAAYEGNLAEAEAQAKEILSLDLLPPQPDLVFFYIGRLTSDLPRPLSEMVLQLLPGLEEPHTAAYWYAIKYWPKPDIALEHPLVHRFSFMFEVLVQFLDIWAKEGPHKGPRLAKITSGMSVLKRSCAFHIFSLGPWTDGAASPTDNWEIVDFIVGEIEGMAKRTHSVWSLFLALNWLDVVVARISELDERQGERAEKARLALYATLPVDVASAQHEMQRIKIERGLRERLGTPNYPRL